MKNHEITEKLHNIKLKLASGGDYDKLRAEAQPLIDVINKEGVKIAKKYGVKHKQITFAGFVR